MSSPSLPSPLIPRRPVPSLRVPTPGHGSHGLAEVAAANPRLKTNYPPRGEYIGAV
ncbi:hypothetical protein BurJ1DRAFT_3223 [Burkholderiales bacterium JOSHI_001]|nr:hypothetical protein BurJ1DRAFT_3223 [Burkholderiales bacterium JOSHI_001]